MFLASSLHTQDIPLFPSFYCAILRNRATDSDWIVERVHVGEVEEAPGKRREDLNERSHSVVAAPRRRN